MNLFREGAASGCYAVAFVLDTNFVDFKWDIEKYQVALRMIDKARGDKKVTDEEIGDILIALGDEQPVYLKHALYVLGALFKSKSVDFEWESEEFSDVFDCLDDMRADNYFTDEELADFLRVLGDTLSEE